MNATYLLNQARANHSRVLALIDPALPATSRPEYRSKTLDYRRAHVANYERLIAEQNPDLAGLLHEEFALREKVLVCGRYGIARPELVARLGEVLARIETVTR